MKKKHKHEVSQILNGLKCSKDFLCYTSGLEKLCEAEDIGLEKFLLCLELKAQDCKFSVRYGGSHFCQCPLRVYISKKLLK